MAKYKISDFNKDNLLEWMLQVSKFKNILTNPLSPEKIEIINKYASTLNSSQLVKSSKDRVKLLLFCKICNTFDDIAIVKNNFEKIISSKLSIKEKLTLTYGDNKVTEYSTNLKEKRKNTDRTNIFSRFEYQYWIQQGYNIEEAKSIAKEIAKKTGAKSLEVRKQNGSYKNLKIKNPICKEFWISRGYTEEETIELRKPFLDKCCSSLDKSIERYGLELGILKHNERQLKRKLTYFKKYGSLSFQGYASKESLKFFIPLYKKLRRLGIQKNDMYFGIKGSKEYRLRLSQKENNVFFYDFTIKSKKIIIEYNNLFWHPRSDIKWYGTINEEKAKQKDIDKRNLAIYNGFTYIEVWNDDNLKEKETEIVNRIFE